MHRVQHAQGQPASARSAHEFDPQTKTAKMAAVRPDYVLCSTARSLEALCRSRLLECGIERLASLSESAIFLQKATKETKVDVCPRNTRKARNFENQNISG